MFLVINGRQKAFISVQSISLYQNHSPSTTLHHQLSQYGTFNMLLVKNMIW